MFLCSFVGSFLFYFVRVDVVVDFFEVDVVDYAGVGEDFVCADLI